jgi:hypothetical protein
MKLSIVRFFMMAWLMLAGAGAARASATGSEIQIEMALEARVSALLERFDSKAMVRVDAGFSRISAPLPGTSLEVQNFAGGEGQSLRDNDISWIKVYVHTSRKELPSWLKEQIASVLPVRNATIDIQAWSPEAIAEFEANGEQQVGSVMQTYVHLQSAQSKALPYYIGFAALALLFAFSVMGLIVNYAQKRRALEMSRILESRIVPALQNMGQGSEGGSSRPTVVQATLTASPGAFRDPSGGTSAGGQGKSSDVAALKFDSLEAVFSDCYWCQQDSYAAWLWSQMSQTQRESIFASTRIEKSYLKWIQVLPKERFEDHLDPIYLSPPSVHALSQDDLARWVERNPAGYHLLSPLRQRNLPISLKTRLTCSGEIADESTKGLKYPDRASAKRELPVAQQFGDLSFDDETTILHNPSFVPDAMRPQLKSLVWLALRPLEFRQRALLEHDAEALAAAWIGAPEVLARLKEALPEKKRAMLDGYVKVVEVNRKLSVYAKLVEAGLDARTTYTEEKNLKSQKAAA